MMTLKSDPKQVPPHRKQRVQEAKEDQDKYDDTFNPRKKYAYFWAKPLKNKPPTDLTLG